MKLSKRLQMSATMVSQCNRVADVGCDHAYTSIYLVEEGITKEAIAMDLRSGPLSIAKENIRKFGLEDKIEMRLSNGLTRLRPGEADAILITGMGGGLVIEILNAGEEQAYAAKELILQPQSDLSCVRRYLHRKSFKIVAEDMCEEDQKFYVSIKAIPMVKEPTISSLEESICYTYGELLLTQRHPILHIYLKREYKKGLKIIKKLEAANTENAKLRLTEYQKDFSLIKKALQWF